MFPELTREELAAGMDAVVEEILRRAAVAGPPVDAFTVARALGMTVVWDDRQAGRARYVRLKGHRDPKPRGTILLKSDPRRERRQWAVAHEIGEHLAPRVFAVWGVDPRETASSAREIAANHLAGRLLLPTGWFAADARSCRWDLLALKAKYSTASHELIARRMLECAVPVIVSIFDQRRISFRRSNLPGRTPPPLQIEARCWQQAHTQNRHVVKTLGPYRTQVWPVHEEDWKREIIRTEVQECWDVMEDDMGAGTACGFAKDQ
ncbi:MAG: ImmA/IrrE family metallo-endopeptidase [Pirellulales bacterium]|nr:ImmA/IrrE family metallo-endopeptidase [Pirellulales bacterium]